MDWGGGEAVRAGQRAQHPPDHSVHLEKVEGAYPGERITFNHVHSSWPEEKITGQQVSWVGACPVDLVLWHVVADPSGQDWPQDGDGAGRPVSILYTFSMSIMQSEHFAFENHNYTWHTTKPSICSASCLLCKLSISSTSVISLAIMHNEHVTPFLSHSFNFSRFVACLGLPNYEASLGFISQFFSQHNVKSFITSGNVDECPDVKSVIQPWWDEVLQPALLQYRPQDIFNYDETSFFYQMMPWRTYAFCGEKVLGIKPSKKCVTLMLTANMEQKSCLAWSSRPWSDWCVYASTTWRPAKCHAGITIMTRHGWRAFSSMRLCTASMPACRPRTGRSLWSWTMCWCIMWAKLTAILNCCFFCPTPRWSHSHGPGDHPLGQMPLSSISGKYVSGRGRELRRSCQIDMVTWHQTGCGHCRQVLEWGESWPHSELLQACTLCEAGLSRCCSAPKADVLGWGSWLSAAPQCVGQHPGQPWLLLGIWGVCQGRLCRGSKPTPNRWWHRAMCLRDECIARRPPGRQRSGCGRWWGERHGAAGSPCHHGFSLIFVHHCAPEGLFAEAWYAESSGASGLPGEGNDPWEVQGPEAE